MLRGAIAALLWKGLGEARVWRTWPEAAVCPSPTNELRWEYKRMRHFRAQFWWTPKLFETMNTPSGKKPSSKCFVHSPCLPGVDVS